MFGEVAAECLLTSSRLTTIALLGPPMRYWRFLSPEESFAPITVNLWGGYRSVKLRAVPAVSAARSRGHHLLPATLAFHPTGRHCRCLHSRFRSIRHRDQENSSPNNGNTTSNSKEHLPPPVPSYRLVMCPTAPHMANATIVPITNRTTAAPPPPPCGSSIPNLPFRPGWCRCRATVIPDGCTSGGPACSLCRRELHDSLRGLLYWNAALVLAAGIKSAGEHLARAAGDALGLAARRRLRQTLGGGLPAAAEERGRVPRA